jgi:xeroderma pigmentosum group C-complementing protein
VFWVEVFNEAVQKWFAVDPIVTKSLAKPSKFEPPASDPYNNMSYVIAFEDDASVRDVTRRYTKAFNAKTRKLRVESTRNGEKWWNKAMMAYEKPFLEDRDEAEISELTSKSAAEPMPRNIQDFKDHPIYAINRHLRRNEVIFPERVIGHVGLSKTTSESDNLEPVYRRSDVHVVRSADKWYRLGRDVKLGEQPLKRVPATRPKSGFASDEEGEESEHTPLYAEFQTEVYKPPPVVGGRIPKNAYGNLDVYVPSMVPPGAVHIKRTEASRAARIMGIDFADAVTGFDFKGRRGTAVFGGIIIAKEYQEALDEVLTSMEDERQHAAFEARSAEALAMWRLFLLKLRIAERVQGYASENERTGDSNPRETSVDPAEAGGGFFPEPDQPTRSPSQGIWNEGQGMGMASEGDTNTNILNPLDLSEHQEDEFGGGFIPEEPEKENLTPQPSISHPQPTSQRKNRTEMSSASRYELVVVPHTSNPTSEELQLAFGSRASKEPEGSSEKVPISVDSPANVDLKSVSLEIVSRPTSPPQAPDRSLFSPDSESEIEKGSLLSEDPEDEDAIPDWLV